MLIDNPSIGTVDIDPHKIIHFPKGLVGMPDCKDWALLAPIDGSYFHWLQSVDRPELMFVVTEPSRFAPDYHVDLSPNTIQDVGLEKLEDATLLVIVNQEGQFLTGNLQGPLLINVARYTGCQLVLPRQQYNTRHVLMELRHNQQSLAA
ncbi:MAG: flagellar assembly protein FliW [Phycisphaerales bacterium]|nr:flagellar assembly protein FliW [Phycisphaerales bacterium]